MAPSLAREILRLVRYRLDHEDPLSMRATEKSSFPALRASAGSCRSATRRFIALGAGLAQGQPAVQAGVRPAGGVFFKTQIEAVLSGCFGLSFPKTTRLFFDNVKRYTEAEVTYMRDTLWTRNFTLITCATGLGAVGGIASSFALSFLVFDETGSTLASALLIAMQFLPSSLLPLAVSPWMDRLPRKPFLVVGDAVNGLCYLLAGLYLRHYPFSYVGYLAFSLLLACLTSMDELAYKSLYPKLLTEGKEEKGYTISSMLYPVLKVVMMPVSALLFETMGVSNILLMQAGLSLSAALLESRIRVHEERRGEGTRFSPRVWLSDLREAAQLSQGRAGTAKPVCLHGHDQRRRGRLRPAAGGVLPDHGRG